MAEIPQFKEEQPVLNPVNVNSTAQGYEAFAKTLGNIAGEAEQQTQELLTEQSQAMYINSVANAEQLKTSAQQQMLEHPDRANKIAADTNYTLDTIKESAFVNKRDRSRLNAYLSGVSNDVALKATATSVKQAQNQAALTHYANWPDQLKAYQQALLTDHDKAEQLKTAMLGSLRGLVSSGAITPEQAGSSIKTMQDVVGIANDHYQMYGNPNATAQDYQTLAASPLNAGADLTNSPINSSSGWLIDYHNNDKTFQGVLADINHRMLPNPEAFDSLQPAQRQHALMAMQGVQVADGMINSAEPYPALEAKYKALSEKGQILSYRDQATRDRLGSYIHNLNNGNYLTAMAQTPTGNAIMNDFNMRNTAIQNLAIDDNKKTQMLLQNKNKLVNEAVAYGEGTHTPSHLIQPIPQADIANVENAFTLGQNPMTVLQTLGQYTKGNQAYVANAMKNPDQRMVVNAVSLSGETIKPQDKLDFIAANQTGRSYNWKNIDQATNDKTLMTRIATNLAPALRMVGTNYDFEQAQALQNSMLKTTLNYAKYLAQKDNNIGATDNAGFLSSASWKNYVDQASKIYGTSFQQMSGTNWVVNPQQLPQPLTSSQLDILADHVTNEGYKYLKAGRGNAEYESAIGRNPLRMVVSPTNDLQAVDGNNKVYFSMPFTSNTMPFVQESAKKREAERKKLIGQAIERSARMELNVRLPEDANAQ